MNRNNCTVEQFNCSTLADTPNNSLYLKQAADPCDSEAIKMLQDEDSQGLQIIQNGHGSSVGNNTSFVV